MMMKYWLALLVLLNAVVLAWQLDLLAPWGFGPHQGREPERLGQQVQPEALKLETLPPQPVAEPLEPPVSDAQPGSAANLTPGSAAESAGESAGESASGGVPVGAGKADDAGKNGKNPKNANDINDANAAQATEAGNHFTGAVPTGSSTVTPVLAPSPAALPPQPLVPALDGGRGD